MLSINIKTPGSEIIYEAKEVCASSQNSMFHIDTLTVYMADGEIRTISSGEAFVMNSSGKTVARYSLGTELPSPCAQITERSIT